jgi:hypothetical protein
MLLCCFAKEQIFKSMQIYVRHLVATIVLLLIVHFLAAQNTNNSEGFKDFAESYQKTNRTGMWILGSWAVGNILVGSIIWASGAKGEAKYFQEMNVAWNVVTLTLAGFGLYQAYSGEAVSWQEATSNHHQMQKILLFNAGLDVGYIATGFFLMEKSKNVSRLPERLSGFGKSLILQGSFLLLFDVSMTLAHQRNAPKIRKFLEKVQIEGSQLTFKLRF